MSEVTQDNAIPKAPVAGPIVGGLAGAVAFGLVLLLLSDSGSVGAVYLAAMVGFLVVAPLLAINLVLSVIYLRRNVPGRAFGWMWGPILAVVGLVTVIDSVKEHSRQHSETDHPVIRERHVNLSGLAIWFDPVGKSGEPRDSVTLPAYPTGSVVELSRYFGSDDNVAIYAKARLNSAFRNSNMAVFRAPADKGPPTILPLNWRAEDFPDVSSFMRYLSFQGGESSVVMYAYFHYPDRVDVRPMIDLGGSQSMDLWGQDVPLVDFHIANLGRLPIARLEIDGATLSLGDAAFAPEQAEGFGCASRNYEAHAINRLLGPLKVRWQLAEANPAWHEAEVAVPAFRSATRLPGRPRSTSVDLYFQEDDSVAAERSQVRDTAQGVLSIRTTGPSRPLATTPACGYAPDRYSDQVKVIRD